MANAIYLLKIKSLSEEFAMSVAPSDDLKFLSLMKLFSDEDEIAVKSCTKSVLSH
jgi:hypothetical protein